MTTTRFQHLNQAMQEAGLEALALNPSPSLVYLTGLHFHLSERPTVFLYRPDLPVALVLPELEASKIDPRAGYDLFPYGDNPESWKAVFSRACNHLSLNGRTIGIEPNRLRVLEQQINGAEMPEDLKIRLQGYITGCYGTLTSFNVLFAEEEDRFRGSAGGDS